MSHAKKVAALRSVKKKKMFLPHRSEKKGSANIFIR